MKPRIPLILVAVLAIVAALLGALLSRALIEAPPPAGPALAKATWIDPPRELPDLPLVDDAGRANALERLQGRWHFVFFGFTNCPDVCPATLTVLAAVTRELADLPESKRPGVVLVSVDPARDVPDKLAAYVHFFGDDVTGITGSEADIAGFASALGVPVVKVALEGGGYTLDHGAGIFLLDPQSRVRAYFSTPHEAPVIAADYRRIAG